MKALAALLCVTFPCLPVIAKDEKAPQRDGAWVAARRASWDLTRQDAPPFRLEAKLEVLGQDGSWTTGTYAIAWASPGLWREEVRFPGYEEMAGMTGDVRWRLRPTRYRPRLTWVLTSPIQTDRFLSQESQVFGQAKAMKGRPAIACIGHSCLDAVTGAPWSELVFDVVVRFGAPAAFPLRPWPATYRALEGEKEVARATIESLEPLGAVERGMFNPPADAAEVPACVQSTPPRAVSRAIPPYPRALRSPRVGRVVRLRATVAADGTVQDPEITHTPHPLLTKLVMDTIRKWQYEPAKCGNRAVPVEMWVAVAW